VGAEFRSASPFLGRIGLGLPRRRGETRHNADAATQFIWGAAGTSSADGSSVAPRVLPPASVRKSAHI
jgi:hypothetical protein